MSITLVFFDIGFTGLLALLIAILGVQIGILLRERIPTILIDQGIKTQYNHLLANFICFVIIFQFVGIALSLSSFEYYAGVQNILSALTKIAVFTVAALIVRKYLISSFVSFTLALKFIYPSSNDLKLRISFDRSKKLLR